MKKNKMPNQDSNQHKKNNWKRILVTILTILIILLSVGLIFKDPIETAILNSINTQKIEHRRARKHPNVKLSAKQLAQNNKKSQNRLIQGAKSNDPTRKKQEKAWNDQLGQVRNLSAAQYQLDRAALDQKIKADPSYITRYILGSIYIPSAGISLPILEGATREHMLIGAGTLKPNQAMGYGNYALAAHNLEVPGMFFSDLYKVPNGGVVYITNLKKIYSYQIYSNKGGYAPTSTQTIVDVPGKKMITLVTCSDGGRTRRIAQGNLIGSTDYNTAPQWLKNGFSLDSNYRAYF